LGGGSFLSGAKNTPEVKSLPNAKVLSEKQAVVDALSERLSKAASGVLVDYKGINVAEDTALRRELRAAGIEYTVVKNTLLRFAVDKCNFNEFDSLLNGTTSLATTEGDPIAPIRIVSEYAKKLNGKFEVKGGFMEGKVLPMDELNEIAQLPGKDALYSKVFGTLLAPITSLAVVLGQILEQKGGSLESAEPAAE
jgi:large subunit ribosomal protein L10